MTAQPLTLPAEWRDFLALTKPRVMTLVVFTGLCGMLAAPVPIHPVIGFTTILCIALGAGAAGALNQWYEADIDAAMRRTRSRPLPDGRMERQSALHFGVGLSAFSGILMGLALNLAAAATGDVALLPLMLFALVFLWTPPHVWALALFVETDYANAGVPMLPVVAGERTTRTQIGVYTVPMAVAAVAPWPLGLTGPLYGWVTIAATAVFAGLAFVVATRTTREDDPMTPEKRLFKYSILYLFVVFAALVADRWFA